MSKISASIPDVLFSYVQTGTPSDAEEGETWYDTDDDTAKVYDGAAWVTMDVESHGQLTNVGSDNHHTRYADSEARSAVDGADLTGLKIGGVDVAVISDLHSRYTDSEAVSAVDGSSLSSLDIATILYGGDEIVPNTVYEQKSAPTTDTGALWVEASDKYPDSSQRWSNSENDGAESCGVENGQAVFTITGNSYYVVSYDLSSGSQNWKNSNVGSNIGGGGIGGGHYAVGDIDGNGYILDTSDGSRLHKVTASSNGDDIESADASANYAIFGDGTSDVQLFDVSTGNNLWSKSVGNGSATMNVAVSNETAAYAASFDSLQVADASSGSVQWSNSIGYRVRDISLSPNEEYLAVTDNTNDKWKIYDVTDGSVVQETSLASVNYIGLTNDILTYTSGSDNKLYVREYGTWDLLYSTSAYDGPAYGTKNGVAVGDPSGTTTYLYNVYQSEFRSLNWSDGNQWVTL